LLHFGYHLRVNERQNFDNLFRMWISHRVCDVVNNVSYRCRWDVEILRPKLNSERLWVLVVEEEDLVNFIDEDSFLCGKLFSEGLVDYPFFVNLKYVSALVLLTSWPMSGGWSTSTTPAKRDIFCMRSLSF
jgi:hypothetical protein